MNASPTNSVRTAVVRSSTATAVLKDGSHIQLRPVTPDDKPLLADGFSRLSARARYLRFLTPSDRLSSTQLAYLAEVDHHDHVAWGALDGEAAAGVGRWVRLEADPSAAEVAITVLDDHQKRGIGRLLLQVLAVSARARGIGVLHFDVLAENQPMNGLLDSLGSVRTAETEIVHHVLDVARVSAPEVAIGDLIYLLEDAARTAHAESNSA